MSSRDRIEEILRPYFKQVGASGLAELLQNETDLLLAGVLMELQVMNGRTVPGLSGGNDLAQLPGTRLNWDNFHIYETDDLEAVDDGDVRTLSPGDDVALVRATPDNDIGAVLGVGAKDQTDVVYQLRTGSNEFGETNTPLGSINDPYHFPDAGGFVPFTNQAEYRARYFKSSDGGDVDVGARLFTYEP